MVLVISGFFTIPVTLLLVVQTQNFWAAKTTQTRLKFEKNGVNGIQEFHGREFAKQTMIDYDGNKKMFKNE